MSIPLVETPTQVAFPGKAVIRTALQVSVPTLIVFAVIASVISQELGDRLPDGWVAWLTGAGALLIAVATTLTRIMAIPGVNQFLAKFGLAAQPAAAVEVDKVYSSYLNATKQVEIFEVEPKLEVEEYSEYLKTNDSMYSKLNEIEDAYADLIKDDKPVVPTDGAQKGGK